MVFLFFNVVAIQASDFFKDIPLDPIISFDEVPVEFQGDVIEGAFELAKLANMNYEDRHTYELSLKYYRDFINVMDTAKKDAKEEGKLEVAKAMEAMSNGVLIL